MEYAILSFVSKVHFTLINNSNDFINFFKLNG